MLLFLSVGATGQDCNGVPPNYDDFNGNTLVNGNSISVVINKNGGARSKQVLLNGLSGSVCYSATKMMGGGDKSFGLSDKNPDNFYTSIKYGFFFNNRGFQVLVDGSKIGSLPTAYNDGDLFKVIRKSGVIEFLQNGQVVYAEPHNDTEILILDVSLFSDLGDTDVSFEDIHIDFGPDICSEEVEQITACVGEVVPLGIDLPSRNYFVEWTPSSGLDCTNCPNPLVTILPGKEFVSYTGTVYQGERGLICTKTFSIRVVQDCQLVPELTGCCFNNYGATVIVQDNTFLNVHCNLVNEVAQVSQGIVMKGEFLNSEQGNVRASLDWINNGYNNLYSSQSGKTDLFGADQTIKGNSPTHFNELSLTGAGVKTLDLDAYGWDELDLVDAELAVGEHRFMMETTEAGAVSRSSGFVSTDSSPQVVGGASGYLSRVTNGVSDYLFPLGSMEGVFRYRPIVVGPQDQAPRLSVGMVNIGASTVGLAGKALNVASVADGYFYRIQSPLTALEANMIAYFSEFADGNYQGLVHWENLSGGSLWRAAPFGSLSGPNSEGLSSVAISKGDFNFDGEPFALARTGFYVNTEGISEDEDVEVTINVTSDNNPPTSESGEDEETIPGGITVYTPSPVPGNYTGTISSSDPEEATDGEVSFTVADDGTITDVNFTPGNSSNGGGSTAGGPISEDLYEVDEVGGGIIFNGAPPSFIPDCAASISIRFGASTPLQLEANEAILLEGVPAGISIMTFNVYNRDLIQAASHNAGGADGPTLSIPYSSMNSLVTGSYRFDLTVSTGEIISGYFLVE